MYKLFFVCAKDACTLFPAYVMHKPFSLWGVRCIHLFGSKWDLSTQSPFSHVLWCMEVVAGVMTSSRVIEPVTEVDSHLRPMCGRIPVRDGSGARFSSRRSMTVAKMTTGRRFPPSSCSSLHRDTYIQYQGHALPIRMPYCYYCTAKMETSF
jgi:hypothetical protein